MHIKSKLQNYWDSSCVSFIKTNESSCTPKKNKFRTSVNELNAKKKYSVKCFIFHFPFKNEHGEKQEI